MSLFWGSRNFNSFQKSYKWNNIEQKREFFTSRCMYKEIVKNTKEKEILITSKKKKQEAHPEDIVDFKARAIQELTIALKSSAGRNNNGRITVRHRGGGHKKRHRIIDFKRNMWDVPAIVNRVEYDPNRNAPIALLTYQNGHISYILAPEGLKKGDVVKTSSDAPIRVGYTLPISKIPVGTLVHNLELQPGKGGQLCRAGGTSAQIVRQGIKYTEVRLNSGEVREVISKCLATIGNVSYYRHRELGKAGASRWLGIRPHVRGTAMNPVDHPHGGGQGKTKGGRNSCSPWGILTKGYATRNPRKNSKHFIITNKRAARKAQRELDLK